MFDSIILQADETGLIVTIFLTIILLIFILAILASSIKIIREYERVVQFRLGRLVGAKGPGIIFIVPIINRLIKTDLRERYLEVPHQTAITKDNAPVDIDFLIYYKVVDASQSVVQVQNFTGASVGLATTTLRAVVGDIPLDELLAKREQINSLLRTRLDEVTERWGIKVTNVEIREIRPPKDVQDAMVKQMTAERSRRAMVTQADGQRESTVLVAEGNKNAAILNAEGSKQAAILVAEGDRQAAILRAQGFAQALTQIFSSAKDIDAKTMALQYLDTLKALGASPSTKYIFPMEFTGMISQMRGFITDSSKPRASREEEESSAETPARTTTS
jgi:regulator of protease activity HflC (stomatin/prohibitin superfamily)